MLCVGVAEGVKVKEALWMRGLRDDLGIQQECVKMRCDSQSAIYSA